MLENTIKSNIDAFRHFASNRAGRPNIDSSWTDRLIFFYLDMYRKSEEYRWELTQGGVLKGSASDQETMTIPCIELEEVDRASECPCAVPSGCYFQRSVHPMPELVPNNNKPIVTNIIGGEIYSYVKWYNLPKKLRSRKSSQRDKRYHTFKNIKGDTYLYILNTDFLKSVSMTARFVDRSEVLKFPICGDVEVEGACDIRQTKFVIREELKSRVFELAFSTLINMRASNGMEDRYNDNQDDTAQTPKLK